MKKLLKDLLTVLILALFVLTGFVAGIHYNDDKPRPSVVVEATARAEELNTGEDMSFNLQKETVQENMWFYQPTSYIHINQKEYKNNDNQ